MSGLTPLGGGKAKPPPDGGGFKDCFGIKGLQSAVDLGDDTGPDGTAAFTDSETQAFLNGNGGN